MSKLTAENVIFISYIKKSCHIELQPFDSHYAIFHLCEFSLVPKCAYLEDPLYHKDSYKLSTKILCYIFFKIFDLL